MPILVPLRLYASVTSSLNTCLNTGVSWNSTFSSIVATAAVSYFAILSKEAFSAGSSSLTGYGSSNLGS
jgi:hypothetical protein